MRQRCRHSCFLCTRDRKISKKYIGILKSRVSWFPLPIPDLIYSRLSQCETKYSPLIVLIWVFFLYSRHFIFSAFQTKKFRRYFTSLFLHLQVKNLYWYFGYIVTSFFHSEKSGRSITVAPDKIFTQTFLRTQTKVEIVAWQGF